MEMDLRNILVFNTGSSSHKCALFNMHTKERLWTAHLQWSENSKTAELTTESKKEILTISSRRDALEKLLKYVPDVPLIAIGHRVVHGGKDLIQPTQITEEVLKKIEKVSSLAPLHNDANLEGIEIAQKKFPNCPHFAVFDTAFHHTLPKENSFYPIPFSYYEKGIQRYGFHGINFAFCSKRMARLFKEARLLILCHLGAGSSLCAVKDGKSIDTTMGMTPLEGLMMATRSGSIDPGIVLYLMRNQMPEELNILLNHKSGLLGLSGVSSDIRVVIQSAEKGHSQSQLSIATFIHILQKHIGMMLASLSGVDAIVFTGGIGENSPFVRQKCLESFPFLDVKVDQKKNSSLSHEEREISSSDSKIKVYVIPAGEEWEIAEECYERL